MVVVACVWFTIISLQAREVLGITKDSEQGTTILHRFHSKNWGPQTKPAGESSNQEEMRRHTAYNYSAGLVTRC